MSRALLNPPALRVACVMLSSVRPGKSRSSRCPISSWTAAAFLFLQDCVAVNSQDVVDTADAQTLSKEAELRLRILAELDALVHCAEDICLAQELVADELPRPDSNAECDATGR